MRKLMASVTVAVATLAAAPVLAADIPHYPPDIEYVPPVDYDIGGSFYLRGSAAMNLHWAREVRHDPAWGEAPYDGQVTHLVNQAGYGYSWGVGFGYETGDGLRFDATVDMLEANGLRITKSAADGTATGDDEEGDYTLMLRSTLALANAYYDFSFGGPAFGYVGAGAGLAFNHAEVNVSPASVTPIPTGGNITPAAAIMAGVGYDMGTWVADVGYRGIWLGSVNNSPTDPAVDPGLWYQIDNNFIHELRGTVRYRFN